MKKLILSFVFLISMGATLFITTSSTSGDNYHEHLPQYKACVNYWNYEMRIRVPYDGMYMLPCPHNAAFFYEWDEGYWIMMACPIGHFFCTELQACTYPTDRNCSWEDTVVCNY